MRIDERKNTFLVPVNQESRKRRQQTQRKEKKRYDRQVDVEVLPGNAGKDRDAASKRQTAVVLSSHALNKGRNLNDGIQQRRPDISADTPGSGGAFLINRTTITMPP